jgi:hypothetical protein
LPGSDELLAEAQPKDWLAIGGGHTMGLRWLNLGYVLGFRKFELHGMDSSFRGGATHAYPDHRDGWHDIEICGYRTRVNFLQQVMQFGALLTRFSYPDMEPVEINVHGDGLLQSRWREYKKAGGSMSACEAFTR